MTCVSIIVPARNAASTIDEQLAALARQVADRPTEVVVVDNGSTDGTAARARGWADRIPALVVLSIPQPLGASGARNAGAQEAGGELLVFCDADDVAAPGWLAALVDAAPRCDMIGGPVDVRSLNSGTSGFARDLHLQPTLTRALGFLPFLLSGNLAVWARVFNDLGGWNERYRNGEDVELSWRAQLRGYQLGWAPDAVMQYRIPEDDSSISRKVYRFGRAESQLYRDFGPHGMPRSNLRIAARQWGWGVARLPLLLQPSSPYRPVFARKIGYRAGRLVGSARHRVLYL